MLTGTRLKERSPRVLAPEEKACPVEVAHVMGGKQVGALVFVHGSYATGALECMKMGENSVLRAAIWCDDKEGGATDALSNLAHLMVFLDLDWSDPGVQGVLVKAL